MLMRNLTLTPSGDEKSCDNNTFLYYIIIIVVLNSKLQSVSRLFISHFAAAFLFLSSVSSSRNAVVSSSSLTRTTRDQQREINDKQREHV